MTRLEKKMIRKAMGLIHGDSPDGYTQGMNILAMLSGCDMRAVEAHDRAKLVSFAKIACGPSNTTFSVTLPKKRR